MLHCEPANVAPTEQRPLCCDHQHEQAASAVEHECSVSLTKHDLDELLTNSVDRPDALRKCMCDHVPVHHHDHLYILEHGNYWAHQGNWIGSLVLLQAYASYSDLLPQVTARQDGLYAWIQPPPRVGILTLLGHLRI